MDIFEYDDIKLSQDSKLLKEIIREIETDSRVLFASDGEEELQAVMKEQDMLMDCLDTEYERLLGICREISHIAKCIEDTRTRCVRCEEKISDLLGRLCIVENTGY